MILQNVWVLCGLSLAAWERGRGRSRRLRPEVCACHLPWKSCACAAPFGSLRRALCATLCALRWMRRRAPVAPAPWVLRLSVIFLCAIPENCRAAFLILPQIAVDVFRPKVACCCWFSALHFWKFTAAQNKSAFDVPANFLYFFFNSWKIFSQAKLFFTADVFWEQVKFFVSIFK